MRFVRERPLSAALLTAAAAGATAVAALTSHASVATAALPNDGQQTTTASGVSKVLVIAEENESRSTAFAQMPYLASVAGWHGQSTRYYAVRHPSLPNYLALSGGSTFGVTSDVLPAAAPIRGRSLFGQAFAVGKRAKVYAESMPANCYVDNAPNYAVRHTGWPYYVDERTLCRRYQVPLGGTTSGALRADVNAGTLPAVGWVIPNLCNDGHDCALPVADAWLKKWLPVIKNGADYRAGRLAVIITFDEGSSDSTQNIPFVVVSPYLHQMVSSTAYSHYSLVRAIDEMIGAPPLREAANAPSLRRTFHLY